MDGCIQLLPSKIPERDLDAAECGLDEPAASEVIPADVAGVHPLSERFGHDRLLADDRLGEGFFNEVATVRGGANASPHPTVPSAVSTRTSVAVRVSVWPRVLPNARPGSSECSNGIASTDLTSILGPLRRKRINLPSSALTPTDRTRNRNEGVRHYRTTVVPH